MSDSDGLDLTSDAKKKISAHDQKIRDRQIHDLKGVLDTPEGRRVVWRVLEESGVFRATFNSNALVMAFNEGKRDIGLLLIGEINARMPHRLTQMQNEHASDKKVDKAERDKLYT